MPVTASPSLVSWQLAVWSAADAVDTAFTAATASSGGSADVTTNDHR